jgi:hypothetical protein
VKKPNALICLFVDRYSETLRCRREILLAWKKNLCLGELRGKLQIATARGNLQQQNRPRQGWR